jgi:hypothetical protein
MGSSGGGQVMGRTSRLCQDAGIPVLVEIYLSSWFFSILDYYVYYYLRHVQACRTLNCSYQGPRSGCITTLRTRIGSAIIRLSIISAINFYRSKKNTGLQFHRSTSLWPITGYIFLSRHGHGQERWYEVQELIKKNNES